ncbi:TM2 domain-containing protein 1 [Taenia solium]|eukprot:TsM_000466400 transcript=TsM_000466400 gene=TsM_000466400
MLLGFCFFLTAFVEFGSTFLVVKCSDLLPGQYTCNETVIDRLTQQPVGCEKSTGLAEIKCFVAPNISCIGMKSGNERGHFFKNITCLWTNGYSYGTALILSIFGGIFGLDRFYLGYFALGALKMWSLGGLGLWYLVDVVLLVNNFPHPLVPTHQRFFIYLIVLSRFLVILRRGLLAFRTVLIVKELFAVKI